MKRQAGFTLIEVLVAMGILSVGATAILSLFSAAMTLHQRSIDRVRAALMAEDVLARIEDRLGEGAKASEVVAEMATMDFSEDYPNFKPRLTIEPILDNVPPIQFDVRLSIHWGTGGSRADYVTRILRKLDRSKKHELGDRPDRIGRHAVAR